jgi:protease IV
MTRRLASALFLIVVIGIVIAGIAGAAGSSGIDASTSTLEHGRLKFQGSRIEKGDDAKVAVVPVIGEIRSGSSDPSGGIVGSEDTVALIEAIVESDQFDAILLELDTPGGGVLASAEIADAVRRAQAEDLKVLAWMRNSAASGGYYISAPADHIVAAPETLTGSIGVILQYFTVQELAGKVGIKSETIKTGRMKDIASPWKDATPEERAVLQELIDEAYDEFVDVIAKGRDMREGEVRELADGRVYTGAQAERLGLVDTLGLREQAYEQVAKLVDADEGDLEVVEYRRSYSFGELLASGSARALEAGELSRVGSELLGGVLGRGLPGAAAGDAGLATGPTPGLALEYRAVP